jgi:hypothetical protein
MISLFNFCKIKNVPFFEQKHLKFEKGANIFPKDFSETIHEGYKKTQRFVLIPNLLTWAHKNVQKKLQAKSARSESSKFCIVFCLQLISEQFLKPIVTNLETAKNPTFFIP